MGLGKLPVPGRPPLIYLLFPLSPSLWETARYRLKYCLKGPLNPKTTNLEVWPLFILLNVFYAPVLLKILIKLQLCNVHIVNIIHFCNHKCMHALTK